MTVSLKSVLPIMVLSVMGCTPTLAHADSALLDIMRKAGEARAALASVPPLVVMSPNGEAQGYMVDFTNLVLKGMEAPAIKPVVTSWDTMLPGLQAHQFDLAPGGLLVSEERCKVVIFSAPTLLVQDTLYVLQGNPKGIKSYSQIASDPNLKLAVLAGAAQERFALRVGIKPDQLIKAGDIQAGAATVTSGRAQAFVAGQLAIPYPEKVGLDKVFDEKAPTYAIAVAFRKEDAAFRDEFDKQLDILRGSGKWQNMHTEAGLPNWDALSKLKKASDIVPSCL